MVAGETVEDVTVYTTDRHHFTHLGVWAASWDPARKVFTVDCRNPETGVGEVHTYPARSVVRTISRRRRVH